MDNSRVLYQRSTQQGRDPSGRASQAQASINFAQVLNQCYLDIDIDRFVHLACIAYCLFGLFQRQQLKSDWMAPISARHCELSFSRLRQGLQHFAISRVLFPKSAPEANLKLQSPELDQILRLVA